MDKNRPAADRIRPILEAMERSIDSARRKRCNTNNGAPDDHDTPNTNRKPNQQPENGKDAQRPAGGDDAPPRLKARPKRPMNLRNSNGGWRSAS